MNQFVKSVQAEKKVAVLPEERKKDLAIVLYLLEMKYMTMDQIIRKFFEGAKVEERLQRLLDEGLIETKDKEMSLSCLMRPSTKGYEEVKKAFPDVKVPIRERSVFPPRLNHDLMLNDLRIRFEELGFLLNWQSETKLREIPFFLRSFKDLPDALCKKKNDKAYFLELEVAKKNPKLYRDRIKEYLEHLKKKEFIEANIEGVIFFCAKPEVVEIIRKEIPEGAKGISVQPYSKYFKAETQKTHEQVIH